LVSHITGRTWSVSLRKLGAEDNILVYKGESNRRLEKTVKGGAPL
jgi:hypothetical protein